MTSELVIDFSIKTCQKMYAYFTYSRAFAPLSIPAKASITNARYLQYSDYSAVVSVWSKHKAHDASNFELFREPSLNYTQVILCS